MEKGGFAMSRRSWSIAVTAFGLAAIIIATLWYVKRDTPTPPEEQKGTELVEMLPARTSPEQVAQAEEPVPYPLEAAEEEVPVMEAYAYMLRNDNGYVTVYRLPENEIYEYTEVIMDILPAELQEEIREGKYLKNEEELYNFLENYTS